MLIILPTNADIIMVSLESDIIKYASSTYI